MVPSCSATCAHAVEAARLNEALAWLAGHEAKLAWSEAYGGMPVLRGRLGTPSGEVAAMVLDDASDFGLPVVDLVVALRSALRHGQERVPSIAPTNRSRPRVTR